MFNLSTMNPSRRFTGLADGYARHRPSYPAEAIDFLIHRLALSNRSLLVDVGSGTGISARLFAQRGIPVIGIEPNDEMRAKAELEPPAHGCPVPIYQRGTAEATGLSDGCADVVLCAQAFHWFEADRALAEFQRLLKPPGWVVLLWNERDESDTFTREYGDILRSVALLVREEKRRQSVGRALWHTPLFVDAQEVHFTNEQVLDEDGLIGRAFSVSYLPREGPERVAIENRLRDLFARGQQDGQVRLKYRTTSQMARRAIN